MRTSRYLLATLKETPADAEVISHQLLLRAGMIRRVAAGVYNWLPMGLRVLKKVEAIVREEMDQSAAMEVLLPAVQPADLWQESGRWNDYGPELLRFVDRHKRDFCYGPTHEEVITQLVKNDIRSYKQLPVNFYQIQTKFRDEIRPRFGLMRGREFIMKDAYSFDIDADAMKRSYQIMRDAYVRIFDRLNLEYCMVDADSGSIGGSSSQEFHVLADSGEDDIAFCHSLNYAANVELVPAGKPQAQCDSAQQEMTKVATPNVHTMDQLAQFFDVDLTKTVKTLIVQGHKSPIALVLRGDHQLNAVKAEKIEGVIAPLTMATDDQIKQATGSEAGSIGPVGLNIPVYVDHSASVLSDFIGGANESGYHLTGINWQRDTTFTQSVDLRQVIEGDLCPEGSNGETITIRKGIEVGHIFELGQKYSAAMDATCLDSNGKAIQLYMGCYGIGVSRIVAASIEQNNDDAGIIWPESIAPFHVVIIPIGYQKSDLIKKTADDLYQQLSDQGIEVLLDDRDERPGVMFKDMELIGIPHTITIGEKSLANGDVEYKHRLAGEKELVKLDSIMAKFTSDH